MPPDPPELEPDPLITFPDAWKQSGWSGLTWKATSDMGHAALHAVKERLAALIGKTLRGNAQTGRAPQPDATSLNIEPL
jgi:hypothetical protein